jgi:hypothetical protein
MSLFCLLWIPLFYLFKRSISDISGVGGVWALLLGSLTAIFQFFLGDLINPGGFGFSRWLAGFVDIVGLPVLAPLAVCLLLVVLRIFPDGADYCAFALLWLIPVAALRAVSWSSLSNPLLLAGVPLLWTATASGIPFFINCIIRHFRWYLIIPAGLGILAIPLAASTAYWALFSQRYLPGFLLFAAALIPMLVSLILDWIHSAD